MLDFQKAKAKKLNKKYLEQRLNHYFLAISEACGFNHPISIIRELTQRAIGEALATGSLNDMYEVTKKETR